MLTRMAMKFDGVAESLAQYNPESDNEHEHEHRDAEHEHDEEPEQCVAAKRHTVRFEMDVFTRPAR